MAARSALAVPLDKSDLPSLGPSPAYPWPRIGDRAELELGLSSLTSAAAASDAAVLAAVETLRRPTRSEEQVQSHCQSGQKVGLQLSDSSARIPRESSRISAAASSRTGVKQKRRFDWSPAVTRWKSITLSTP